MHTIQQMTDGLTVPYDNDNITFEVEHVVESDTDENFAPIDGFRFNIAPYGLVEKTITVPISKKHLQELANAIINVILTDKEN